MGATYRYALNNAGVIIDIITVTPDQRDIGAPYTCVGCGTTLIPVLGSKTIWHFRHQHEQVCPNETYLHRLAKHIFATTYQQALDNRQPFHLIRHVDGVCTHFEDKLGFTCNQQVEETPDLTRHFTRVDVEASIDTFRADVLLSSTTGRKVLLIEFAVSHRCDQQKIASGKRIIEIQIQDETDIQQLLHPVIRIGNNVRAYNLMSRPMVGDICEGNCSRKVHIFMVSHNQKGAIVPVPAYEIERRWNSPRSARHVEYLGHTALPSTELADMYRRKVREAYFADIPIQNCYICKYHGISRTSAVFCKVHKANYASHQALGCEAYRPLPSMEECEATDKANIEYLKRLRSYTPQMTEIQAASREQKMQVQEEEQGNTQIEGSRSTQLFPITVIPDPWSIWKKEHEVEQEPTISTPLLTCVLCGKQTHDYWSSNKASKTCKCRTCYRAGRY